MPEWKFYNSLSDDAKYIRQTVFVEEQGLEESFYTNDDESIHIVIYDDGHPVSTARMIDLGEGRFLVGRVATLHSYRGQGLGRKLLSLLEKKAKESGGKVIEISAQCRAQKFYEKNGYTASGELYLEQDCEHIHMEKRI